MRYRIEVSEKQLKLIWKALEDYERTRMGQFFDFAEEIASVGFKYDKEKPDNEEKFYEYIWRRNDAEVMFLQAFKTAQPELQGKTEDMLIAEDIWTAIRYFLWEMRPEPKSHTIVDARTPLKNSDEPMISIEPLNADNDTSNS